jgi:hypothetical protein
MSYYPTIFRADGDTSTVESIGIGEGFNLAIFVDNVNVAATFFKFEAS